MDKERLIVKIVKTEKGNIDLVNADGNIIKNVPPVAILGVTQNKKLIEIRQQNDASFYVDPELLQATQVLPAAEVPFDSSATTIYELLALLRADFFFEVTGGGFENFYMNTQSFLLDDFESRVSNNFSTPANIIYTRKIIVEDTIEVTDFLIQVNAAAVGNAVAGIYDLNRNGFPNGLIVQTGSEFDLNITGVQTVSCTNTTIETGAYAMSFLASASTATTSISRPYPSWGRTNGANFANEKNWIANPLPYTNSLPMIHPASSGTTASISVTQASAVQIKIS